MLSACNCYRRARKDLEGLETVKVQKCLMGAGAAAAGEYHGYWKVKMLKGHAATGEQKMLGEHFYSNHFLWHFKNEDTDFA